MSEYEPVRKVIIIEVVYDGCAKEGAYGQVICKGIESGDHSKLTQAKVISCTRLGVTPKNPEGA